MASEAQINANRRNAQRSTGPRSAAGKAKVALNALAHGLTAVKGVASVEGRELFEALRAQLTREWRPGSVIEVMLVDRIAELIWQLKRVGGVEVQVLERMPKWRPPGVPPELFPMADALVKDFAKPNPILMRVQLYQARLERAMYRALRELKDLQIERQMQDEREDVADEESTLAPLPGERLGEGTAGLVAKPEGIAVETTYRVDAADGFDASSPHFTSPGGEGSEARPLAVCGGGGDEKTNPISRASVGRTMNPAAAAGDQSGDRHGDVKIEPEGKQVAQHCCGEP